jgi:hypothetical protein
MNITKLFLALTSGLLAVSTAHAQLSAYGTVTVRRMTDIPYTQGTTNYTNGNINPVGGTVGAFYDFRNFGPVRLGVDGRGSIANSTQSAYPNFEAAGGHLNSGLGGVRATFHTPLIPLKPYVEGMVGVARTNFGTDYNQSLVGSTGLTKDTGLQITSHLEYDVFAGVDYAVLPLIDLRIELGYGGVEGHSHTYPVQTGSAGIVFHIPFSKLKR